MNIKYFTIDLVKMKEIIFSSSHTFPEFVVQNTELTSIF